MLNAHFQNNDRLYPTRGVPNDVQGVYYSSKPMEWTDKATFVAWMSARRVKKIDQFGRKRNLFVDKCSGHSSTSEGIPAVNARNMDLCKLPKNNADLIQQADSLVISKLRKLEAYKVILICKGE